MGIIVGITLFVLLILLILVFGVNKWKIELNGKISENYEVIYGSEYATSTVDATLTGTMFCKDGMTLKAKVSRLPDVSKLGEYDVTYTYRFFFVKKQIVQKVTVKDRIAPIITLKHVNDYVTNVGETYEEEGYIAVDDHDGDITSLVEVGEEKDGEITYRVADSSGNETVVVRKIHYVDTIPPVITLVGESEMSIAAGFGYTEPGYLASDNYNGDMTSSVVVDGYVDAYKSGSYTLYYTATDSFGNVGSATRTVTVTPTRQADNPVNNGKVVYLTFDDGPGPYTQQLLDVLALYNVKATFFVVNGKYNSLIAKEAAAGHSVGIHSYSHKYDVIYQSEDAFFSDLYAMQAVISQQAGYNTTLMRFPGGGSNGVSSYNPGIMSRLTTMVGQKGFTYFDWNVASGDAGGTTSTDQVFNNVISGIQAHNSSVVLQHDIKGFSVDAVEKIVSWGLAHDYIFLPLNTGSPTMHHPVKN